MLARSAPFESTRKCANNREISSLPRVEFFLFGPRGAGKSTWLRMQMPEAVYAGHVRNCRQIPIMHFNTCVADSLK